MSFGEYRICYNNFAGHLLNNYNPNLLYPGLEGKWSDDDWRRWIDMLASFGFNIYEFWLEPFFFCRQGLASPVGHELIRVMNLVCEHGRARGVKVEMLAALSTVGPDWKTYCPNRKDEWAEVRFLWDVWTRALPGIDIVGIFPGDPGGCSLDGCTAETYIDRSVEIATLVNHNIPRATVEFGTWGPPFFGWGIIEGPPGWNNEFVQAYQGSAWKFTKERMEKSMRHLVRRLPDFPAGTSVAINMGFTPDGNPDGENNAIAWAKEIAKTNPILTWDFSLTEGENAVMPHYRFKRLFEQRRAERAAASYSGGICFTMTPRLNQLSLYQSAQSFLKPDADPDTVAGDFYEKFFGPEGRKIVPHLPLFEVIPDWGNHVGVTYERESCHKSMMSLADLLESLKDRTRGKVPFLPSVEEYRKELLWFARWFADVSESAPDYDGLAKTYWSRVYCIYDHLKDHVDPRPKGNVKSLVDFFRKGGKA